MGLAERRCDEVARAVGGGVGQALARVEHAGGLAWQVDARLLHQAEGAAVVIQRAAARPQADVGEGDVAGFLQGAHDVEASVVAGASRREPDVFVVVVNAVAGRPLLVGGDDPL